MGKKVLIITYYWPPAGGPGVQRALYFVKHLRKFGWEPVVYTVKNGEYHNLDPSFESEIPEGVEVLKTHSREPYFWYKLLTGRKKEETLKPVVVTEKTHRPFFHRIAVWIRGNFFIPDARMWWIGPSIRFLVNHLNNHPVDAVFSTSPPQSMHLIAKGISEQMQIPWIADFRDPWTRVHYYEELKLTKWADQRHKRLEKSVLSAADRVTTVGWKMASDFEKISQRKVDVITNGYEYTPHKVKPNSTNCSALKVFYLGSLSRKRNPIHFWEKLIEWIIAEKITSNELKFLFVGNVESSIFEYLDKIGMNDFYSTEHYVPHDKIWAKFTQADILFLIGIPYQGDIIPGKLFEYFVARKPIFGISPKDGDIERLIEKEGAGLNADFDQPEKAVENFKKMYAFHKKDLLQKSFRIKEKQLAQYSRENLTRKLAEVLDEVVFSGEL